MISYLLVVEQHRTQIVIHALLKCQQENLYHEQNVTHRSEERFSRNDETDLVCRLLLEKKKKIEFINMPVLNTQCVALYLHFLLIRAPPTVIYTLSLHDALPIWSGNVRIVQ